MPKPRTLIFDPFYKNSLSGVCKALFGETFSLGNGDGYESWKTDRPMRKEGFNIGKLTTTFDPLFCV